jgi:creatinine amidohydrolase
MPLKRNWVEMTTQDFADADAAWIAVLPVAAVEQHGPHLPVGTDAFIAEAYLARAQKLLPQASPVTFLPLHAVGTSHEHRAFAGTLTLGVETFVRVLTETAESVQRAGIRKLVIANSHGGNVAAIDMVALDLRVRLRMLAVTCSFAHLGYPDGLFSPEEMAHGIHGGDIETSIVRRAAGIGARRAGPQLRPGDRCHGERVQMAARRPSRRLRLDEPGPQSVWRDRRRDARDRGQRGGGAGVRGAGV